jgi:hypothetical protein
LQNIFVENHFETLKIILKNMREIALKSTKQTVKQKIENNIDDIILMIENDISYSEISKKYGIVQSNLSDILNSIEYRARKDCALEIAAEKRIKDAENYLLSINEDDNNSILKKKTSLSEFNIYLAKVKCKKFDLNYKSQEILTNNNNIITPQLTLKVINHHQKTIDND